MSASPIQEPARGRPTINNDEFIKLNVGGTLFITTRSTLAFDEKSMLARMFASDSGLKSSVTDNTGEF